MFPIRHSREPKRHTSIHDLPPGSIKSSLHREADKRQIICLMAEVAFWAAGLLTGHNVYCFLSSPPASPQLSCKVGLRQRINKCLLSVSHSHIVVTVITMITSLF